MEREHHDEQHNEQHSAGSPGDHASAHVTEPDATSEQGQAHNAHRHEHKGHDLKTHDLQSHDRQPPRQEQSKQEPKQEHKGDKVKQDTKGITIKKADDMAQWYGQVVTKADVADYTPIRGFMIIKPRGYYFWQRIQDELNARIAKQGVRNAYFPLLIPESFFKKEAEHAEGFSPEVAWIESHPDDQERYAIRPTSETIIYDSYARWVRSWRDLPLRMNQWCNIVRWEVQDTKIFLRTREFLWQEGHCVYETEKECHKETLKYLELYRQISEDILAVPVVLGKKSEREKFAGAVRTYTIEGLMPDGKALQMGTSHDLGQGFAKAFNISFLGKDGATQTPWQNSWGVTTRLLGAMIMMHGDDKGLVLPPRVAPNKVVIVPILFDATKDATLAKARELHKQLKRFDPILDDREGYSAGFKFNEHELTGVPLRIEVGPRDLEKQQCVIARRDTGEKHTVALTNVQEEVRRLLDQMQQSLLERAKVFMQERLVRTTTWDEMTAAANGGRFALSPHCGSEECESEIKDVTRGITTRCIPLKAEKVEKGTVCVRCGKKAQYWIYFARAY
jgi:prolyl-tRNA synthetase